MWNALRLSIFLTLALWWSSDGAFAQANNRYAEINSNGTKASGVGVTSSTRMSRGNYRVVFNRNVTSCSYIATLTDVGIVTANGTKGFLNAVTVVTRTRADKAADIAFKLFVVCPN